jgi:hypothetical protein
MQARSQTAPPLAGDLSARTAYADTERPARVPPTPLDDWMPAFLAQLAAPGAQFIRATDNEGARLLYLSEGLTGLARRRPRHPRCSRTRHRRRPRRGRHHELGSIKGYRGAGGTVRTPCRGRWETLSTGQQAVNRSHAKIRALVEQAMATLKSWRLLRRLRCSTTWITSLVQAVLCLHPAGSDR